MEELLEQVKDLIEPMFDDEIGQDLLEDLAKYIEDNLNDI